MGKLALIAGAGAVGVLARYAISLIAPSIWATMGVNVLGSLLLGALVHLGRDLGPDVRDVLGVGLLGGFTTFSTFSVHALLEADGGRPAVAAVYVGASVTLGVAAAALGFYGARALA